MGQYYNPVVKDSDGNCVTYRMTSGLKLTEHSWIGNDDVEGIAAMLYHNPQSLAWVGDYVEKEEMAEVNMSTHEDEQRIPNVPENFDITDKYIVNHTKNEYINVSEYIQRSTFEEGWTQHPLSLLTAMGNGRGGGDYYSPVNAHMIGKWAGDVISIEDVAPREMDLLDIWFCEDKAGIEYFLEHAPEYVTYYASGYDTVTSKDNGIFTFEDIGELHGNKVYADMYGEVLHDENGELTLSQINNANGDKAYVVNDWGERTYFDLDHDILEKLEKATEKLAYREFCEKIHEELYEEYKQSFEDGFELEDELRDYMDWAENVYPDEGYFVYHVDKDLAKFLIEHDELLDLDYCELYEESIKPLFRVTADDLTLNTDKGHILTFDYTPTENFWESNAMDKLIDRVNPDLLAKMYSDYDVNAENYEQFAEYMAQNEGISDYISFEIDLKGKSPNVTACVDICLPSEAYPLTDIPLSAREQAFVLKAAEQVYQKENGKTFDEVMKNKSDIERD